MITIKGFLKSGPDFAIVIAPTDTVFRALQLMAEKNINSVAVSDGGQVVGIFTEQDYCRRLILMGRPSLNTPIREIISKQMISVHSDQTLEECLELMTRYHVCHLPVNDGEKLIGKLSMQDVMGAIISTKQDRIECLENYILGTGYGQ